MNVWQRASAGSGEIEKQAEETTNQRPITVEEKCLEEDEFWLDKTNTKNGGKNRTLQALLKNEENGQQNRNSRPNPLMEQTKITSAARQSGPGSEKTKNAMRSRRRWKPYAARLILGAGEITSSTLETGARTEVQRKIYCRDRHKRIGTESYNFLLGLMRCNRKTMARLDVRTGDGQNDTRLSDRGTQIHHGSTGELGNRGKDQAPQQRLTNEHGDPPSQQGEEPEQETEMHSGTWTQKQKTTDKEQTLAKIKLPRFSPNTKVAQTHDLTTDFSIMIK
jgi:hypothetical protein